MEKFSNWRDKGTGISPFMPNEIPTFAKKNTSFQTLLNVISSSPLFLIKLPFFIIVIGIYAIFGFNFLLRFIIQVLFNFKIDFSVDGIKKSETLKVDAFKPQKNDLIIANYITPLDGYFFTLFSGSNTVMLVPDKSGSLYRLTPYQLFKFTFSNKLQGTLITDISKFRDEIVFLLLEGTSSNNKSILPFITLNSKYQFDQFSVKSLVYKVYPNYFTLPIPYINKWQYIYELMTNLSKKQVKLKIYKHDGLDYKSIIDSFQLNSLNLIKDLSIDEKDKFRNYYFNYDIN